jgi:hypothetical protein
MSFHPVLNLLYYFEKRNKGLILKELQAMMEFMKGLKLAVLCLGILLFLTRPAHAYLDPGSGSMVLQLLLGGVAALGVVIKLFWHRILHLFGIRKDEDTKSDSAGPEG